MVRVNGDETVLVFTTGSRIRKGFSFFSSFLLNFWGKVFVLYFDYILGLLVLGIGLGGERLDFYFEFDCFLGETLDFLLCI